MSVPHTHTRSHTHTNIQQEFVAKERKVQSKLDDLLTNLAKIEESIKMKSKTIRESRATVASISKEMAAIGSGAAALEGVEQELARAVSVRGRAGGWDPGAFVMVLGCLSGEGAV